MKKNIEKFLGKFDGKDKGVPIIVTTLQCCRRGCDIGQCINEMGWVK